MLYRVIVAGGRDFNDYQFAKKHLDKFLGDKTEVEIVSGCAKGADALGELYASEREFEVRRFPANWKHEGLKAGPVRNERMANYAHAAVLFWDGISPGTKNMLELCRKKNIPYQLIFY